MRFTEIYLAGLEPPDVVETLSFEAILDDMMTDVRQRFAAAGIDYDVDALEPDPVRIVLQVAAYRELLLRARVNTAARAVLLATSQGSDLDHIAALYGVKRFDGELDEPLRERVQLAPEALSTAGPPGAYIFHARAVSVEVRDAFPYKPVRGKVHVYIMSTSPSGVPTEALIDATVRRFRNEDLVPFTDEVVIEAATPMQAQITAVITIGPGPDPALVRTRALERLQAYLDERRRIGRLVAEAGIKSALMVPGAERVSLIAPTADLVPPVGHFVSVSDITVTVEVAE